MGSTFSRKKPCLGEEGGRTKVQVAHQQNLVAVADG